MSNHNTHLDKNKPTVMKIELISKNIKLTNTIATDIGKIVEFESSNKNFVGIYSRKEHISLLSDKDCLHLSIIQKGNNILVGHMILFGLKNQNKSLEFRRIAVNKKGFGFGREALKLLKQLCFENLKYHRLWLDVYDDNSKAIGLYESEGFIQEGLLRDNTKTETKYRSQRIYSLLENEYSYQ